MAKSGGPGMGMGDQFAEVSGALQGLTGALSAATSQASRYVEAASPSAVLVLNQAMYDLTAVVGGALTPVVLAAAEAVKMIGGVMMPVMRALTPVVSRLTGTFLSLLEQAMPGFEALGDVVVTLAGWFGDFVEIVSPIVTVVAALTNVFLDLFKGLVDFIAGLFGAGTTSSIKGAFQEFAKYLILAVASLARFVGELFGVKGGGMIVQSLLKTTDPNKKREDITGMGVAKDAQIQGFLEYGRKVSTAALIAGSGAGPEKQTNDFLADIHSELQKTAAGNDNKFDVLLAKIEKWIVEDLPRVIAAAARGAAYSVGNSAAQKAVDAGSSLNASLGLSGIQRWIADVIDGK